MEMKVHGANIEVTDAITSHVQTRFTAALDKHERQVEDVTIRLEDINGPKGGVDMRCQATIHLRPGDIIVVEEIEADLYAAISVAADRAKHVVSRKLDRMRTRGRHAVARP
jgi:putative sigma-54 modulation protein